MCAVVCCGGDDVGCGCSDRLLRLHLLVMLAGSSAEGFLTSSHPHLLGRARSVAGGGAVYCGHVFHFAHLWRAGGAGDVCAAGCLSLSVRESR